MPLLADFVLIIDGHHIWALFYPENSCEARFILSPMSKDSFARVLLTLSVLGLGLRIARTYYYLLFTGVIPGYSVTVRATRPVADATFGACMHAL